MLCTVLAGFIHISGIFFFFFKILNNDQNFLVCHLKRKHAVIDLFLNLGQKLVLNSVQIGERWGCLRKVLR